MTSSVRAFSPRRALLTAGVLLGMTSLAACSGGSGSPAAPGSTGPVGSASLRVVHASPDAGPVDVYVYSGSTLPATPTISGLAYPAITGYLSLPVGTYTVAVYASGSTTTVEGSETLILKSGLQESVAVAGQVGTKTLQFQNFVEPAETAGTSALIVHHASPAVAAAVNPVGVAVYPYTGVAPVTGVTIQAFTFSLTSAPGSFVSSGPAANDATSGGEFFLSPLPTGLPSALGFAAGTPASVVDGQLNTVAAYASLSGLASGLSSPTSAETTLAADTSEAVPAGAHLSVFAVDSITSPPGILIGTLDP